MPWPVRVIALFLKELRLVGGGRVSVAARPIDCLGDDCED